MAKRMETSEPDMDLSRESGYDTRGIHHSVEAEAAESMQVPGMPREVQSPSSSDSEPTLQAGI